MAQATRGLKLKPNYEDLINVAVSYRVHIILNSKTVTHHF